MKVWYLISAICCLVVLVSVAVAPMMRWEQFAWPLICLLLTWTAWKWRQAAAWHDAERRRALVLMTSLDDDGDTGPVQRPGDHQV